jgi:hypothetical protein
MKLKQAVAAVAGAFCVTAASAVTIQLPSGAINAASLDWAETSFLAQGGISAIGAFQQTQGACPSNACDFNVFTHGKVTGYNDGTTSGLQIPGINTGFELTMVASFTETVTLVTGAIEQGFASFSAIPNSGFLQLYLDDVANASDLGGTGFNDGKLILVGRLTNAPSGNFTVTQRDPTLNLDNAPAGDDDWGGQQTVDGFGSQANLVFEVLGFDQTVFTGGISSLSILFENVSIALPFESVDPSRCFSPGGGRGPGGIGSDFVSTTCGDGEGLAGILPVLGTVNGGNDSEQVIGEDFMAQTDFNSPLRSESIPEPGSIALLAGALLAGGAFTRRRRQKA